LQISRLTSNRKKNLKNGGTDNKDEVWNLKLQRQNWRTTKQQHTHLFLEHVKVVNNDTNEEVKCEEGAANNEDNEVQVSIEVCFSLWLQVYPLCIYRVFHHFHPAFECSLCEDVFVINGTTDGYRSRGTDIWCYHCSGGHRLLGLRL